MDEELITPCVKCETVTDSNTTFIEFFPGDQDKGYAEAVKVNEEWASSATMYLVYTTDSIPRRLIRLNFETDGSPRGQRLSEWIPIDNIPYKPGCYNLLNISTAPAYDTVSSNIIVFNYDSPMAHYRIDEQDPIGNQIEITSIDSAKGTLSGKFSISYIRFDSLIHVEEFPERLRYFNGHFEVELP